ncbi:Hypp3500 [Branchiostoma lanceolatum]|uniref:Hypp3500 protein n=1 Tax=Branchiostoma lanceolatum TaxID=7740 RepID=A0A8K0A344_BRALA|nr:Hypp3500 [Branchiostoma lanceolatum]
MVEAQSENIVEEESEEIMEAECKNIMEVQTYVFGLIGSPWRHVYVPAAVINQVYAEDNFGERVKAPMVAVFTAEETVNNTTLGSEGLGKLDPTSFAILEPCLQDHSWDIRDPVEQGWVVYSGVTIYTRVGTLTEHFDDDAGTRPPRVTYYRPAEGQCSCRQYKDGLSYLLHNVDSRNRFYMGLLLDYLSSMIDSKQQLKSTQNSTNKTRSAGSDNEFKAGSRHSDRFVKTSEQALRLLLQYSGRGTHEMSKGVSEEEMETLLGLLEGENVRTSQASSVVFGREMTGTGREMTNDGHRKRDDGYPVQMAPA